MYIHVSKYKNDKIKKKSKKKNSQAGGVAQVVELLTSKCEALSSNACTKKKKITR
jgi:hypothetical protein